MKLFLIGLPGSGKSTIGKALAKKLDLPFFDLDAAIISQIGESISTYFEKNGEEAFRKIESQALTNWCSHSLHGILATGGGTPCFFDNMKKMNEAGFTVFLNCPPKKIAQQLSEKGINKRPLLKNLHGEELEQHLQGILQERLPFYQQAHFTVKGTNASEILDLLAIKRK